jgi:hypothetical protein
MDLYVRRGLADVSDPEVIELSALLNVLWKDAGDPSSQTLRNPNGVHLKLCNFRAKDQPGHGMTHGNHLEQDVWDGFATRPDELRRAAYDIKRRLVLYASGDHLDRKTVDMRSAAQHESISSLSNRKTSGQDRATALLMALIREAADLASRIEAGDSRFPARATSDEFRTRLDGLSGLVREVTKLLAGETAEGRSRPSIESMRPAQRGDNPNQTLGFDRRKLVIFPCGEPGSVKHFNRTVRRPVDLTALALNTDPWSGLLPPEYRLTEARVWGVMPRASGLNETRFKQVAAGDIALFTGSKKAFCAATIQAKLRSADLARALWHTDTSGKTWELAFLLSEPVEVHVPYEVLSKALGYAPNFAFQSFMVLSEEAAERTRAALGADLDHLWRKPPLNSP